MMIAERARRRPPVDCRGDGGAPSTGRIHRGVRGGHRPVARRRPCPGERRGRGVRRRAGDVGVQRRLQPAQPRAQHRGGQRHLRRLRPGVPRAAGGRPGAGGVARRGHGAVDHGGAAWGGQRPVHTHGPAVRASAVVRPGQRVRRPGGHAHPDPVPDRGDPRHDRRGHGDPQLGADLRRAGVRAGRVERRDHPGAGAVRPRQAARRGRRGVRLGRAGRDRRPVPDPAAAAPRAGYGPGLAAGVRQPGRAADPAADDPGLDRPGADQHQPDAGHGDRDPAQRLGRRRPELRVPAVHAAAGPVLGGRLDRALPRTGAAGGPARPGRRRADRLGWVADDHLSAVACGGDLDRPGAAARPTAVPARRVLGVGNEMPSHWR